MEETRHLVLRAADGTRDQDSRLAAFGQLVVLYQDMAYGYAYTVLGDFHLAEDASQDAFVTAYRQLANLRQPEAFASWLRRIVHTSCTRLIRRRNGTTAPLEAAMDVKSPKEGPGETVEAKELQQDVLRAIRSLPEAEREVTTLFYINGYSQQEVADFLEVPVTTVNNRLHASRERLKERMITMVEETLKDNAPDEQYSKDVMLRLPQVPDQMGPIAKLPATLDTFQGRLILNTLPKGTEIVSLQPLIPIYRYPLVARCRLSGGEEKLVEVHAYAHPLDSAERGARLLGVLAEMGLPVQELLAGPAVHPDYPEVGPMVVLSHLPGKDLPFVNATAEEMDLTCRLMIEGIMRLHSLTEAMRRHPIGTTLPDRTLIGELDGIVHRGGPWMEEAIFRDAVRRLRPALEAAAVPLVFSNGLNLSWNFRYDGRKLTGYQLFERACFDDPLIELAKYKFWATDPVGWRPFDRAGFVERFLYEMDMSKSQFAPRLALRCLYRLQECVPVHGGNEEWIGERESCLMHLENSLRLLK